MQFNTYLTAWNPKAAPSPCQTHTFTEAASSNAKGESLLSLKDHRSYRWAEGKLLILSCITEQNRFDGCVWEDIDVQISSSVRPNQTPRTDGTQLSMRVFLLMSAAQKTSKLEKICDLEQRHSFNDLKDLDKREFLSVNAVKHVENIFLLGSG